MENSTYMKIRNDFKQDYLFNKKYTDEVKNSKSLNKELEANEKFRNIVNEAGLNLGEGFHTKAIDYFEQAKTQSLYKIIHQMPKGALLHHHFIVHAGVEYYTNLIQNEENAYVNFTNGRVILKVEGKEIEEGYINVMANNIALDKLKSLFFFSEDDKRQINHWELFNLKINNMKVFCTNEKYFKNYLLKTFYDCINEGVLIYQGRHFFGVIQEYNSSGYISIEKEMEIIFEAIEEVRKKEPLFEANFIYIGLRFWGLEKLKEEMAKCVAIKNMRKDYNELILGFDLVGDETLCKSKDFADTLRTFKEKADKENDFSFDLYLHAGEADSHSNDNMIDSVLLNTPRIGHGINLINHLYLIDEIKKRNICLECCPLSNQILNYVHDLRSHPAKKFLDDGVIITLNSDDDGVFDTESMIVYDYFIGALSMGFTLLDFKQVTLNSLNHSHINPSKLEKIKEEFLSRWELFINNINNY